MKNRLLWRGLLIVAMGALAAWVVNPPKEKINLGLDLQGGIHLVLQVQTQDAIKAETDREMEVLRREAADEGIASVASNRLTDTSFEATGFTAADLPKLEKVVADWLAPGWNHELAGDGRMVFQMRGSNETAIRDGAVNQALQTIRNRIDQFGVAEPVIARQGIGSSRACAEADSRSRCSSRKRGLRSTIFTPS